MSAVTRSISFIFQNLFVTSAYAQEFQAAPDRKVFATIEAWDPQGMSSISAHADKIDVLQPKWIALAKDGSGIDAVDLAIVQETSDFAQTNNPAMQIAPVFEIPIYDDEQVDLFSNIIQSTVARERLVDQLVSFALEAEVSGFSLRFNSFEKVGLQFYVEFVSDLHAQLNAQDIQFYQMLAIGDRPQILTAVEKHADAIVIELGLEHSIDSDAGPLASQLWFEKQISDLNSISPLGELVISMPSLAIDWRSDGTKQQMSLQQAYRLASAHAVNPITQSDTKNSTFKYTDADGVIHNVWMLDGVSAYFQLQSMRKNPPFGISIAQLGEEDVSIWPFVRMQENISQDQLFDIDTSKQIQYIGNGEVFSVSRTPKSGEREMNPTGEENETSLVRLSQVPNGYEILLSGSLDQKLIALTFDDGPDPLYTPAVMDILAEHNVPATFFAIGEQMVKHPEIIERMLAEGHNVGSHTFSHINISSLDTRLLNLELNTTQSIFEAITGRNLALFRAPFSADSWPVTVEQIASLVAVSDHGYISVGAKVDTRDWNNIKADEIARRAVTSVKSGNGQIIMLHDGGGDRTQTINALPTLIKQLKNDGYSFVTVAEFLGRTADDVMPVTKTTNPVHRFFVASGFQLLRWAELILGYIFLLAIILGCARALILIVLSFKKTKRAKEWAYDKNVCVDVVIPAYNEVDVIAKTVKSVLKSAHENINILIVDDGSTDGTYEHCCQVFENNPKVKVITQPNAGKSAALNLGFSVLNSDIVIALDADTVFDQQAIPLMLGHFSDPTVAAVSGNAKVGNRTKLLTKWQALEYVVAQNLDRRAFEYLNCITVVPGAVGAWRREAVMSAGGFGSDTLAEDADLTVRLLRAGHQVKYEEFAIAYTEAPETVKEFSKQRLRWMFGMMQVGFKNLGALRFSDSKSVGFVAIPNILIFQILFPLIAPLADFAAICILADLFISMITNSNMMGLSEALYFLMLFGAFIALDFLSAFVAFWHEKDEDKNLLFWLLPQRFFYRQLIYIAAIQALISAFRGQGMNWGHLRRTGTVVSTSD